MRDKFVETIIQLAKEDKDLVLITGDLGFGVLKPFWECCPNQFVNAGISEQNMTSVAAGLSLSGKTVFTYSIGNFPTIRCLEQIRNDCAYHNANVKIVCVGGGFTYGSLGMSHHATEDISIMRSLPNVCVFAPGDLMEAEAITKLAKKHNGTCYIRLGRGGEQPIHKEHLTLNINESLTIENGKDIAIFSTGAILSEVVKAVKILKEKNYNPTLISFPIIKPIDEKTISKIAETHRYIFTIEENNVLGGFGSAVVDVISRNIKTKAHVVIIGINDEYVSKVGNQDYLRKYCSLDAQSIVDRVIKEVTKLDF